MPADPRKVFISYSHDSPEHEQRVLSLAERLRKDGIDAQLDQYVAGTPSGGWPRWMEDQLDSSELVLVVCTETYHRRFLGREEPNKGKGADWEGILITLELYHGRSDTNKFVPVLFGPKDEPFIPRPLSGHTHYLLSSEDDYTKLYAFLTGQAGVNPAKLGPLVPLAHKSVDPLRFTIHNLPFPPNPTFTGRDSEMKELRERLLNGRGVAITQAIAVHGLGGVGKTELAVEYAWEYLADYNAALWVNANSPEALDASLAALASLLGLCEAEEREQAVQIKAVLGWLGEHERWLIIADNADTEQVAKAVYDRFVPNLRGHVLVTSRLRRWPVTMPDLSLDLFLPEDATRFLLDRVAEGGHNAGDETTARKLAEELGCLPLALEQAAAFIIEVCWSFDNYYQHFREARPELLNYHTEGGTRYPASAARTWSMTLDQLSPLGRALLRVAAWVAPEDIPRGVFSTDPSVFAEALDADRKFSALSIEEALGELSRFSLIRLKAETVSVHRLLQAVEQDSLSAADKIKWIERAAQLFNAFTPEPAEDVTTQKTWIKVSEHADTLLKHAEEYHVRSLRIAITAHEYSQLLRSRGTYGQAERAARMALTITEECSGPVELLAIRLGNLAMVLKETNQMREAESLLRRALRIDNDTQDADKRRIIVHLSNLGQLLQESNRLEEAERLITQARQMGEQYLDPDSPQMATVLNNLATLLQQTGRFEEAEPLLLRALGIDEKTVGKEHVNIATRLNNLAVLYVARREFGEAERLFRQSLAIIERCFPKDHPRVALALNNLADVLHATGRVVEAKLLIEQALRIDRSSLVLGHPQLASHLFSMGVLLKDIGRLSEAETYVRESLEHLIAFANATGHLPSELRQVISTYRSIRLTEEHDPNEITLAIGELGRPLGFDICLWEFTDTGGAEISDVQTQILELANQYAEIRRTMPSSADRTQRMELIASKMRSLALPAYSLLSDLLGSESTGQRLAAVSILEAIPNTDHLLWLTQRIAVEKPFIGYHAAIALLNAARNFRGSENHAAVQVAIRQALQNLDRKAWKDPNQLAVLKNAEQELKWVTKSSDDEQSGSGSLHG